MRRAAKKDINQPEVIKALKGEGATVTVNNQEGVLDLTVGYKKRFMFIEVKSEDGKLTKAQIKFLETHKGCPMAIVRNGFQAINALRLLSS